MVVEEGHWCYIKFSKKIWICDGVDTWACWMSHLSKLFCLMIYCDPFSFLLSPIRVNEIWQRLLICHVIQMNSPRRTSLFLLVNLNNNRQFCLELRCTKLPDSGVLPLSPPGNAHYLFHVAWPWILSHGYGTLYTCDLLLMQVGILILLNQLWKR